MNVGVRKIGLSMSKLPLRASGGVMVSKLD